MVSHPPPPPPPRNQQQNGAPNSNIPVVEVVGWTRRARPAPPPPPRRDQRMPGPPPPHLDGPYRRDAHPMQAVQPPMRPSTSHGTPQMMLPQPATSHMPLQQQQSSLTLPMPPLQPMQPQQQMMQTSQPQHVSSLPPGMESLTGLDWNANSASAAAPPAPAWLTMGYAPRAPLNSPFGGGNGPVGDVANSRNGVGGSRIGTGPNGINDSLNGGAGARVHGAKDMSLVQTPEAWSTKRVAEILAKAREEHVEGVEAMRLAVDGRLRASKGKDGPTVLSELRDEKWVALERARNAVSELHRLERDFARIDAHAAHIDAKISRLRSYSKFIENGWEEGDEPTPDGNTAVSSTRGVGTELDRENSSDGALLVRPQHRGTA